MEKMKNEGLHACLPVADGLVGLVSGICQVMNISDHSEWCKTFYCNLEQRGVYPGCLGRVYGGEMYSDL